MNDSNLIRNFDGNNKNGKILIVVIVILSLLLIVAVGYICYDNFLLNEEGSLSSINNNVEKIDDSTIDKLYSSLLTYNDSYGFYFNADVNIENIAAEQIMPYVAGQYTKENNFTFDSDLQCALGYFDDFDNFDEICGKMDTESVSKDKIDEYVKKLFGVQRNFVLKHSSDDEMFDFNGCHGFLYDDNKKIYYFGLISSSCSDITIYRNKTNVEQKNEYIYIYDVAFVVDLSGGAVLGYKNLKEDDIIFSYDLANQSQPIFTSSGDINSSYFFEKYKDKLNSYKHTFKLSDDGNY